MATFFNNFPFLEYSLDKDGKYQTVTNIFRRFKPLDEILNKGVIYYAYHVKDGETPEIVSYKIYDTVDYHWIITMFNQRFDPYFQWVLSYDQFNEFLEKKYGSVENSTQLIHHYEMIIQPKSKSYDGTIIDEISLTIDKTTFDSTPAENTRVVYCYDYEFEKNEQRRKINILDETYISQIITEKEKIFNAE